MTHPAAHHKMSPLRRAGDGFLLLAALALMLATTTAWRADVFFAGGTYFVDADCYSRMTRVAAVLDHPFTSIRHHAFENFPAGIATHTTAPLDWLIALLAAGLAPFRGDALDLAGAWISPLLGLGTVLVLWAWMTRERLPFRAAALALLAVSPIVVQAFRLGRPDHQSLLVFLLTIALAAEFSLWRQPRRAPAAAWGVASGLALWTSLYEPAVLFTLVLVIRFAVLRRDALGREWRIGWLCLLAVVAVALAFDGWRVTPPDPVVTAFFPRWALSIGELASLPPWSAQFLQWLGLLAPALPLLLAWTLWRGREPRVALALVLVLATFVLTCWQIRWGCYLVLAAVLALPFALAAIPWRPVAWAAFVVSLWPIATQWEASLFPDARVAASRAERRADSAQLREIAGTIDGPFLAPWWLSPPLAYWSRQPGVAGSSHQSLPGTVDVARFYLSADPAAAADILRRRQVRCVVAYEPDRVLPTAVTLLGEPSPPRPLGLTLYRSPAFAPSALSLVRATPFFRLYAFDPSR